MITQDAGIPDHMLKEWEREIPRWVEKNKDNLFARNVLPVRKVGEAVQIDVVSEYTRSGLGAQVVAKGAIPKAKTGLDVATTNFTILQLMDGFDLHEKDMATDPKLYNRLVDICLKNTHRLEDNLAINGDSNLNITGIITAAQANPNGKIVASGASGNDANNNGAWAGESGTDLHGDLILAINRIDGNYSPKHIAGNRKDLLYLFRLDSERQPYYKTIAPLFGVSENTDPMTWIKISDHFTQGKVYVLAKDPDAAELVVSENPQVEKLPKQRGGMYPVEITEWAVPEFHDNKAFVEIAVT